MRLFLQALTLVIALGTALPPRAQSEVFPGAIWQTRTPAAVDLDESKLQELAMLVGGSGMIARYGYQVFTWGSITSGADWASASKPVLSTLLFVAVDRGLCSLDSAVGDFLSGGSAKDSSITLLHLANMTSGYSRAELPGAAWAYNDHAINLYGHVLCELIFGASPSSVYGAELEFLQFEDAVEVSGSQLGRIKKMSVRDFARIGLFWARAGNWSGVQQVPASYFESVSDPVAVSLPRTSSDGPESWNFGTFGGGDDQIADGRASTA